MKNFKKLIALVLCLAVVFAVCGCGGKKDEVALDGDPNSVPETPYEINWYLLGTPQADVTSVENAINEYLKDKINATVKMTVMESGQYKQKMSTMVSAGEYFDIAFCASWMLDYAVNAGLGAFVALDDYMDTYLKDVKEQIPQVFLDSTRVGGKMYAIPAYKEGASQYGWIYRKDIADKYGIDMSQYKTLEDFEPVAQMLTEKIQNNEIDIQYPIDWDKSAGFQEYMYDHGEFVRPMQSYDVGISYCEEDDPSKIIFVGDKQKTVTPEDIYNEMRKYYVNGWVKKDVATAKDVVARFNSGKTFCYVEGLKPGKAAEISKNCPYPVAQAGASEIVESVLPGTGSMMAISSTSKNPARCARFLNLLNTDPVLKNLVVHGIEGKHYEKVDDKTVKVFEDTTYSMYNATWSIGNVFIDYITTDDDPNKLTDLKEFNEKALKREANSFSFDPAGLEMVLAELSKVSTKYGIIGAEGSVDLDYKAIDAERTKELYDAGLQDLIDAMQEQYTEYLKNRNDK